MRTTTFPSGVTGAGTRTSTLTLVGGGGACALTRTGTFDGEPTRTWTFGSGGATRTGGSAVADETSGLATTASDETVSGAETPAGPVTPAARACEPPGSAH